MRICLLTGGYPYRRDALGGWCRTLVAGLTGHTFHLITSTDHAVPAAPAYCLPANVASARAVAFAGPVRRRGADPGEATAAAVLLCRGLLDDGDRAVDTFSHGLRRLSALAGAGDAAMPGVPLTDALLDAWQAGRAAPAVDRMPLPRLCVRDARTAATLLRHVIRALAVRAPDADLLHCVGGTTPLVAALAVRWRTGTPLLLTETHAPAARDRPAEERLSPVIRTILRRFRRAVARTGYAEAGLIAPLSAYHHRWSLRHGAPPARLVTVPVGVDPDDHPAPQEPATAEPTPAEHVAAGQVVVYRAKPADPPYPLIEAMMAGRAVVAADVGPVAETLGDAGVLVPSDDPAALTAARAALLRDPARRRDLGDAARRRALGRFTADRVVRAYDALYTDLAGPPPAPVFELTLALPAPRATRPGSHDPSPSVPSRPGPHGPATVRDPGHPWSGRRRLTQEER